MKPRPANASDLRIRKMQKSETPKDNSNHLGVIVTTAIGTLLVVGSAWAIHQHRLKNQIVILTKKLDEASNNQSVKNTNS